MKLKPGDIIGLLKDSWAEFGNDKAARLGAALAYYTIFAIGPLVLLAIVVAGIVFGRDAAQGQIVGAIQGAVGTAGAEVIQGILEKATDSGGSIFSTIFGFLSLVLAAGGLFGQLQDALNTIWGVRQKPGSGIMETIRERLLTFLMVLLTGLLAIASLVVNSVLSLAHDAVTNTIPGGAIVWQIINYVVSFGLMTLVFAVIYRFLPDVHIRWSDVWVGAAVTAGLFILGQLLLALYFSFSDPGSPYGAASSLVVFLVWIYYAAQIVFFGAEFTQVYANKFGAMVRPKHNAEWVSLEERAKQGMKGEKEHKRRADREARGEPRIPPPPPRIPRFYGPPKHEPEPQPLIAASSAETGTPPARESAAVVGFALVPVAVLWAVRRIFGGKEAEA